MRTPRGRPDLRLAESYIPAAITYSKGIFYTLLCLIARFTRWPLVPPLVVLYYDHTLWTSAFMDSSSICLDIVMGTLFMLNLQPAAHYLAAWAGLMFWSLLGACHIVLWPHHRQNLAVAMGHLAVPTASLACVLPNTTSSTAETLPQWPFMCRSGIYLLLLIIDIYTMRPPTQRERDRVGMMRYGAVLFAPTVAVLLVCVLIAGIGQTVRLYYPIDNAAASLLPIAYEHKTQEHNKQEHNKQEHKNTTNAIDALDFQEAFKLAKLQSMDGKNSR